MNSKLNCKIRRIFEISLCLTLIACACGMNRFGSKPLPELGYGGEAKSLKVDAELDLVPTFIAGNVGNASGGSDGALWRPNSMGGFDLTVLPSLGGPDTTARCIEYDNGDPTPVLICGGSQTPSGAMKPVYWSSVSNGPFSIHMLQTLGGAGGVCNGILVRGNNDFAFTGISQMADGRHHATYWRQIIPGVYEAKDLDTLGGQNSEALGVTLQTDTGEILIVGRSQTPGGAWHACSWEVHNDGEIWSAAIKDRHPGGASSVAFTLDGKGTDVNVEEVELCGTATTVNGKSIAFKEAWAEIIAQPLTVSGFQNTSADTCSAHEYGHVLMGRAWNNPANRHAIIWNIPDALGETRVYNARELALDDYGPFPFTPTAMSRGAIVGSLLNEGGAAMPFALIADGAVMPDDVSVPVGVAENNFSEVDLWHGGDGRSLRIKTNNQGDSARAVLSYYCSSDFWSGVVSVKGRVLGNANAAASATVRVFNFVTSEYDVAGNLVMEPAADGFLNSFPSEFHINPLTGEVRVRIDFARTGGNVRGYELDEVILAPGS